MRDYITARYNLPEQLPRINNSKRSPGVKEVKNTLHVSGYQ